MAKIKPYKALIYHNACTIIEKTDDMKKNIACVVEQLKGIVGSPDKPGLLGGPGLPVRLIALPEAFCTGWPDTWFDFDQEGMKKVYDTTVPGPETDMLGEAAKYTGAYIMACMQARDPDLMEDRFFNMSFIINPEGRMIYKRHKSSIFFRERVTCPSDIWDQYIEKYGNDAKALLDALFPVVKTDIGNLATAICGEGDKPEPFRALAMNGAEVVYRPTYPAGLYDYWELQNRAHAFFNNVYLIAPNNPVLYLPGATQPAPGVDTTGHIVDYWGQVIGKSLYQGSAETLAFANIDIEALRHFRVDSLWQNWLAQLRMEEYILPYQYALDIGGLYPKNLQMDEPSLTHRPHDYVLRWCVNRAVELGIYTAPSGWKPYKIPKEITDKIEKAKARSSPRVSSRR